MIKVKRVLKGKGTLGALEYRAATQKASGLQNMSGGKRYNMSEEQKNKLKKMVRQVRKKYNVVINPEKPEPTGY